MKSLAAALGTLLALTACANGTASAALATAPAEAATAAPAAARTATPRTRVPVGPGTPRPRASSVPRGARSPHAKPAAKAAPLMPQILGVTVSPTVVGSGSFVSATVTTTPGVVRVTAFAAGTSLDVPRVGPGLFRGSTTLPPLPPFAHGRYAVTFVAHDARGRSTQSAVGVTVR